MHPYVDRSKDGPLHRLGAAAPFSYAVKPVENKVDMCCYTMNPVPPPNPCDDTRWHQTIQKLVCVPKEPRKDIIPVIKRSYDRIILFRPVRWRCKDDPQNRTAIEIEPTLGRPVGVCVGAYNLMFLKPSADQLSLLIFATCLIAFGEYYITPEVEWDTHVINRILEQGMALLQSSTIGDEPLTESKIRKNFILCGNTMEVELDDPFLIGRVTSQDMRIQNLHWGLVRFFRKHQHCMLQIGSVYYLLWRNFNAFFMFEACGRDRLHFQRDLHDGLAMLLCVKSVENLSHLLLNLSSARSEDMFTIRRMKMTTLLPCCAKAELPDKTRRIEYVVVSEKHAVLKGHLHLGLPCFHEIRYKQSLPVSLMALVYAKIDPTSTWTSRIVDEIILHGTTLYKELTQCDFSADFCVQDMPSRFRVGQFTVEMRVTPMHECGMWQCVPNYRCSELTQAVKRTFTQQHAYLLVQIERRSYPLWRKGEFYYLLDAYCHACTAERDANKMATVHMCCTLDTLCCNLTQSILEISSARHFLIHLVTILRIEETSVYSRRQQQDELPCSCIAKEVSGMDAEAASLNESIVDLRCQRDIDCLVETNIIEEDVPDLDSPGVSDTQLVPDFKNFKKDLFEGDGDDESESESTAGGEDDDDDDGMSKDGGSLGSGRPSSAGLGGKKAKQKKDKGDKDQAKKDKEQAKKDKEAEKRRKKEEDEARKKEEKEKKAREKKEKEDGKKKKKGKGKDGDDDKDDKEEEVEEEENVEDGVKNEKKKGKEEVSDEDGVDKDGKTKKKKKKPKGEDSDKDDEEDVNKKKKKKKDNQVDEDGTKKKKKKKKAGDDEDEDDKDEKMKKKQKAGDDDNDDDQDGKKKKKKKAGDDDDDKNDKKKQKQKKTKREGRESEEDFSSEGSLDSQTKKSCEEAWALQAGPRPSIFSEGDECEDKAKARRATEDTRKSPCDEIAEQVKRERDEKNAENQKGQQAGRATKKRVKGDEDETSEEEDEYGMKERQRKESMGGTSDEDGISVKPNRYPGFSNIPYNLAVVGSETGSYESLCGLIRTGFKCADRILIMTPWGNYVVFSTSKVFLLFDGCTCNINRFRHLDLRIGTAGLLSFDDLHNTIKYIRQGKETRKCQKKLENVIEEICDQYCEK